MDKLSRERKPEGKETIVKYTGGPRLKKQSKKASDVHRIL